MGDSVSHEQSPASPDLDGANWEMDFYEDILKRRPDFVEVLMVLGNLYTGHKLYAKGLQVDQRLARLRKDDPIVHYNLACSHSLLNQRNDAFEALSNAAKLGYHDVKHMEKDSDLDVIRSDPRYADIVAKMRRPKRLPDS